MTRNGKIARLPRLVRDELNCRLEDGERGPSLLAWLNGHEEVQAIVKAQFGGRPISKQNLSEWRQGGFEDWRQHQQSVEMARGLLEAVEDVRGATRGQPISDMLAEMAALALARSLRATAQMTDADAQRRVTLDIIRQVVRLRASDRGYERAQREAERHASWRAWNVEMLANEERRREEAARAGRGSLDYDSWQEIVQASRAEIQGSQTESNLIKLPRTGDGKRGTEHGG
jgi:hypothetical protein